MRKLGPKEGPCDWESRIGSMDLEALHQVLNCAASRGCGECVRCSESALEQMLRLARRSGRTVVAGLERLEADMEFAGAFGL